MNLRHGVYSPTSYIKAMIHDTMISVLSVLWLLRAQVMVLMTWGMKCAAHLVTNCLPLRHPRNTILTFVPLMGHFNFDMLKTHVLKL